MQRITTSVSRDFSLLFLVVFNVQIDFESSPMGIRANSKPMEAGGNVQKLKLNPHCFKIIHQSHGLWLKRASTTCKHGGGRGGACSAGLVFVQNEKAFFIP
jgi:hypothetical protein